MSNEVVKVVQQSGLVDEGTVQQLRRWGAPIPESVKGPEVPAEIVPALIERAIQSQDYVQVRETDLEVLREYLHSQQEGELKLEALDGSVVYASVNFGRTSTGEFIIPWVDENVSELLGDAMVSLSWLTGNVNLTSPRELFYGERKTFVLFSVAP